MAEENKEPGFFGQIKNQIITTVGLIITAGGGLVVSNMDALFAPKEETPQAIVDSVTTKQPEIIINVPEQKQPVKETIIIKEVPTKQQPTQKTYESW